MRSRIAKILVAVLIAGMTIPAFAAVQNIMVGGDMDVKGLYRKSFDFDGDSDSFTFTYMGTRVWVKAELADNITAMVRLINERDFGNDYLREIEGSIILDLAYVKVADIMAAGLDLTVGRQEIQLGEGLVLGSRYRAIDYIGADIGTAALDYGKQKAFDAVRFDYTFPMADVTVTGLKAKIIETYGDIAGIGLPIEDIDLYALAMKYNGEIFNLEPYVVYLRSDDSAVLNDGMDLYTLGIRAGLSPMDSLNITGEFAKQLGSIDIAGGLDFEGWAALIGVDFMMGGEMAPTLSAGYSHFTEQDATANDIEMWIPVFPANIADRVGKIAYPAVFAAGEGLYLSNAMPVLASSGLQAFKLGASIQPTSNMTLGLNWFHLRALETPGGIDEVLGNELDLCLNYQYTEDLSFGLDAGVLIVGDMVDDYGIVADAKNPWQVIGSMKLAF